MLSQKGQKLAFFKDKSYLEKYHLETAPATTIYWIPITNCIAQNAVQKLKTNVKYETAFGL